MGNIGCLTGLFISLILRGVFQMAYKISSECISCGSCEGECPVGAIAAGDGQYVIDPDACIDCGSCEGSCPVNAISAD